MPETANKLSGLIFFVDLTYCSNLSTVILIKVRVVSSSVTASVMLVTDAVKCSGTSENSRTFTLDEPSTSTLTVPSGNFNICITSAKVPT
ncbi:MAG: hypothetical protein BWY75_02341 [bacterium ADurb.Bin425]|nr:MAG: hypothetical protein BWY75_02341 [bacterium ADurb.Bin425]